MHIRIGFLGSKQAFTAKDVDIQFLRSRQTRNCTNKADLFRIFLLLR